MPALNVFGRRWLVAGDDMPLVSSFAAIFHLAFGVTVIVWFLVMYLAGTCARLTEFTVVFSGILVTYTVSFGLEVWIIVEGMKGSPLDTNERSRIPWIIYLDTVSHVGQVAFNGYLTYLGDTFISQTCDAGSVYWNDAAFIWAVAGTFWLYCLIYVIIVFAAFNPSPNFKTEKSWSSRYVFTLQLSILIFGWNPLNAESRRRHRDRAARFGKNLKSLFGHADVTLTDFILAFAYARHNAKNVVQAENEKADCLNMMGYHQAEEPVQDDTLTLLGLENDAYSIKHLEGIEVEKEILDRANHVFQYALAAYGWMMYLLSKGIFLGLPAVVFGAKSGIFPCLTGRANLEVAMRVLKIPKHKLLFLREQHARPNVLSYLIAEDRENSSIVVSVRGAVTLSDNVRDVLFDPGQLDDWLDCIADWETIPPKILEASADTKFIAHKDYLEASRDTLCDILDQGVLRHALEEHKDFNLIVTGHSLGAACAFFMGLYLKKFIPNTSCWCFSPPLGLVDNVIATSSSEWCTTVVCGKELPPRFSASTLDRSRNQIIYALATIKEPKITLAYKLLWRYRDVNVNDKDMRENKKVSHLTEQARDYLSEYLESVNSDSYRKVLVASGNRLNIPGSIIFFRPKKHPEESMLSLSLGSEREFDALWIHNESLKNQGILLSGRFLSDHMPDTAAAILARASSDTRTA